MQDYSEIIIVLAGSTVLILFFIALFVTSLLVRQKRKLLHDQQVTQLKNEFSQELIRSQLEIREETFKNISQELHDNIGTMISLAMANLNLHAMSNPQQPFKYIDEAKKILDHSITDLKDIARSLKAENIIQVGLLESIRNEVTRLNKTNYYEAVLEIENISGIPFSGQQQIIIFRIFQESINNIIKHADSKKILIGIAARGNDFVMQVKDYGCGFVMGDEGIIGTEPNTGAGLVNIQNRARLLGGKAEIHSELSRGTTIDIIIPITDLSNQ